MSIAPGFESAVAFARDLIRIPSPPGEEGRAARRVRDEMESLGLRDVRIDRWGNVLGEVPGRGEAPPVLLNAHLDVVDAGDPDAWEHPPYAAEVAGGFLHGRGAIDIKGPLAIQTHAAALLIGRAPGDVIVAHTVMEERGGLGLHRLLESGEVRPAAVILGEPSQGDIATGHRGRAELEVVIHGRAGHASMPADACNSLDLLGPVLDGIRELARTEAADPDPVLGTSSPVATMVDVSPAMRNVIPDRAVVVVDWRILPGETEDALVGRIEDALRDRIGVPPDGLSLEVRINREVQTTWTGVSEERSIFARGFLMDAEDPLVNAASSAVGRRGDPSTPARARPWPFSTDGGWSCGLLGIPTLGFAPGEERLAHTNRERMDLEEARWAFERYPDLVTAVQRAL